MSHHHIFFLSHEICFHLIPIILLFSLPINNSGHQDFSEDTYRALAAADNAIMLIDAAKGLEPQTRKLFEVCRLRGLPLFTFANKMDRPALTPYEIMDQIQEEFDLESYPVLWPIGDGDRFKGVLDRMENVVHLYQKPTARGGKAEVVEVPFDESPETLKKLEEMINDDELFGKLIEDREILDELISPLDMERVLAGEQVSESVLSINETYMTFHSVLFFLFLTQHPFLFSLQSFKKDSTLFWFSND
mmetsp:Transcript_54636/g.132681  ORF Transcript_54636/g.132681 Transcript_54636/m.132681 type:complete len:247 (+) Transcript_54636:569-1309(+)